MATPAKDTIYIDVDDEITAIIDKITASKSKVVALVLPKRAAALQSIVNMKLIKRSAEDAGKQVVLITSEAGLLPLAGAVGMYVAKNLQSRPEIPDEPDNLADDKAIEDVSDELPEEKPVDSSKTVGELAKATGAAAAVKKVAKPLPDAEETIDLDDEELGTAAAVTTGGAAAKAKGKGKNKLKIPNFDKFRLKLFIGVGVFILLIIVWWLANFVLPKGKIVIKTDTSTVNASANFTGSPTATEVDLAKKVVPVKRLELKKTDTQTAPATGSKNLGSKASGTMAMSVSCSNANSLPHNGNDFPYVPAGTEVGANNLTFVTKSDTNLSSVQGAPCQFSGTGTVISQQEGAQYNLGAGQAYSVNGYSSVKATGGAMSGGVDPKTVKVVSQTDIDGAKAKLVNIEQAARDELTKSLQSQGYIVIKDSFTPRDAKVVATPNVNGEGEQVSVASSGTYSLIGIKSDDLQKLLADSIKSQIDSGKQKVQDYALDEAVFRVVDAGGTGDATLSVDANLVIGPDIDQTQLKTQLKGKKRGEAEQIIKNLPSVKDVTVDYSPFWVTKAPGPSKLTITLQKSQ